MDIRDRLEARNKERSELRSRLRELAQTPGIETGEERKKPDISKYVTGSYVPTAQGDIFVARHTYDMEHIHGEYVIGSVFEVDGTDLAIFDSASAGFALDLKRTLFIDTETTGLAGGTGTVAFLVGIGFFYENKYVVEQYFMCDYDEEAPMLGLLTDIAESFDIVVSFNGRVFDLPLLETRFLMSRLDPVFSRMLGVDLLFPSRRIWKLSLSDCRLATLEEKVLKFERAEDDVPGSLIPGIYFDFLRTGDADSMYKVFYHNEKDVVSMVSLLHRLVACFSNPIGEASANPLNLYSMGRHYENERNWTMAAACLESASQRLSGEMKRDSLLRLSMLHKKKGEWEKAVEIWEEAADDTLPLRLLPYVELAKYHEHKEKDYAAALTCTTGAIEGLSSRRVKDMEALRHRMARLKRKLSATRPEE